MAAGLWPGLLNDPGDRWVLRTFHFTGMRGSARSATALGQSPEIAVAALYGCHMPTDSAVGWLQGET